MSDPVALAIVTVVGSFFTAIVGLANTYIINRNHRETNSNFETTNKTLQAVQKQTNGLTDDLVKSTAKESFARGVKSETDKPTHETA